MNDDPRHDKIEVIRLDVPAVANEWRRQLAGMEAKTDESWSNQMFAAFLLDIRKEALKRNREEKISELVDEANSPVDEIAKDAFGLDDTEPKGDVK